MKSRYKNEDRIKKLTEQDVFQPVNKLKKVGSISDLTKLELTNEECLIALELIQKEEEFEDWEVARFLDIKLTTLKVYKTKVEFSEEAREKVRDYFFGRNTFVIERDILIKEKYLVDGVEEEARDATKIDTMIERAILLGRSYHQVDIRLHRDLSSALKGVKHANMKKLAGILMWLNGMIEGKY